MKHDPYSLTALIRNDEFISWVLNPDEASEQRWHIFMEKYPDKLHTISSAREYVIILAKDTGRHQPSAAQSTKMWQAVESQMDADSDYDKPRISV